MNEKIELSRELFHAFRKLDILQELLEDPKITEIMVNGTDHIFMKRRAVVSVRTKIHVRRKAG